MNYYFIRVNGETSHDNPMKRDCFVAYEPEDFKRAGYSTYLTYCFENDIVRMGWPDVGDLRRGDRHGAMANCYNLDSIEPHIKVYLLAFKDIKPGSILLVPDRDHSGDIYFCEVTKPYNYDTSGPYECSHRLGVLWDRNHLGKPIRHTIEQVGISKGGWWLRAFYEIRNENTIARIKLARSRSY